jgi:P27 family predicted phage terminase small subunit
MKNSLPIPLKALSAEAKGLWRKLHKDFNIADAAGLLLLRSGLEAFDRMRQAQAQLARDGLTVADRFGQQKQHPCSLIERDSRAQMLACLRALKLDDEAPGPVGRPTAEY